jgi:hypothetical protein
MKALNTLILETDEMLSWYKDDCLLPIEKVDIEKFDIRIQQFAEKCDLVIYKDTIIGKSKIILDNVGINVL